MSVMPRRGGGLSDPRRGGPRPRAATGRPGLRVEFRSEVQRDPQAGELLRIDGFLLMQPDTRLGRLLLRGILRRPEQLACIHYRVREISTARVDPRAATRGPCPTASRRPGRRRQAE